MDGTLIALGVFMVLSLLLCWVLLRWGTRQVDALRESEMGIINGAEAERNEIVRRFSFHPATPVTGPKHDEIRQKMRVLALWLLDDIPPCRERSLALTKLQEAMMFANAAVAIHTEPEPLRPGERDEA